MTLAKRPIDELKERFADDGLRSALVKLLPKHISLERLCAVALNAASQNPILLQCTPNSIIRALLAGAQLGLEPGGPLGAAYMVPYRNKAGNYEAQLIPGYRGLMELARRSGVVKNIEARVVYSMDECEVAYGLEPNIHHVPAFVDDDKLQMVYAVAVLSDGSKIFEVMTKTQVDSIRSRSRAANGGPWVTDYEAMAKKTVVRRLCSYLPLSIELAEAVQLESAAEEGLIIEAKLPELADKAEPVVTQTEKLKKRLEKPEVAAKVISNDVTYTTAAPHHLVVSAADVAVMEPLATLGVSLTPADMEGVDAAFDTPRPSIEEVKLKMGIAQQEEIDKLFAQLEYTQKNKAELSARYAHEKQKLLKDLRKAAATRVELKNNYAAEAGK